MAAGTDLRRGALAASLWVLAGLAAGDAMAADVAVGELEAVGRALAFVESLPRDRIRIGVVYTPTAAGAADAAARTAAAIAGLSGPGIPGLQALPLSADALGDPPADALFLMPGVADAGGPAIADAVRQRRLLSVSTDPACLDAGACVLLVQARPRVDIVIDTAMARAAEVRFSLIFAAMVRRR